MPRGGRARPERPRPRRRLARPAREHRREALADDPPRRERPLPEGAARERGKGTRRRHGARRGARARAAARCARRCTTSSTTRRTSRARSSSRRSTAPAILSVDGFGDFCSTMTAVGTGNGYEVLDRVLFPHSLGVFYAAVTQYLGFPHYGDEGKVMGLAPYGDPEVHMKAMRDVAGPSGDLFALNLDYFTHDKEGVDMTWDEGSPTIGRIFSDKLVDVFGPAREPGARDRQARPGRRRLAPEPARGDLPPPRRPARRAHRRARALPRGRRGAERGRERAHPAGDAVRGAVRPAGGRRLGHRGRRRLLRLEPGAAPAARLRHEPRLHRPRVLRRRDRGRGRRGGARGGAALRRRPLPDGRRADRRGRRRRLVPGPDGVRPARARPPLDRRRPAPRRDEGRPERADQAARVVPAVRALGARRRGRRVVRPGLHLAVHGARLQHAAREAQRRSRRSTTSTAPAASRRSSARSRRATTA